MAQIRDYRHAITFARTLDEVDGDRIGIWGSSYSGAHVLVVGAIDRRVKCVVAQVPLISGHENARRLVRADLIAPTQDMFEADREARYRGEAPTMIPVVAPEGEPCALPTADSYEWFTTSGAERAPSWINECTLRSVEMFLEYEPGAYLPWISPTPLLMVVAAGDHLTVSDLAIDAYERAREPKRLELLAGGHFDAYIADFERSSGAARDWFVQHLLQAPASTPRLSAQAATRRAVCRSARPPTWAGDGAAVRAGGAHQHEVRATTRVPGVDAGDLDAVGEVGDQRHAEARRPGLSAARAQAEAVVGHGDLDAFVVQARGHVHLPGLLPVAVRVQDGVRHGL